MSTVSKNISDLQHENQVIKEEFQKIFVEYSNYREESEEICKEYEETIQLLTTSVETFKSEIEKTNNVFETISQHSNY